jgi:uncharacterized HAD superfamily protein
MTENTSRKETVSILEMTVYEFEKYQERYKVTLEVSKLSDSEVREKLVDSILEIKRLQQLCTLNENDIEKLLKRD